MDIFTYCVVSGCFLERFVKLHLVYIGKSPVILDFVHTLFKLVHTAGAYCQTVVSFVKHHLQSFFQNEYIIFDILHLIRCYVTACKAEAFILHIKLLVLGLEVLTQLLQCHRHELEAVPYLYGVCTILNIYGVPLPHIGNNIVKCTRPHFCFWNCFAVLIKSLFKVAPLYKVWEDKRPIKF